MPEIPMESIEQLLDRALRKWINETIETEVGEMKETFERRLRESIGRFAVSLSSHFDVARCGSQITITFQDKTIKSP